MIVRTWILHEPEAFICFVIKGSASRLRRDSLTLKCLAYESLRLARRVKINEIKSTLILFTYLVSGFTSHFFATCCYLKLFHHLINFHARFR
jgi:hypothetical protein